ncbi:MAG: SH3 domain-containing protein [Spirochaetota bacterium]
MKNLTNLFILSFFILSLAQNKGLLAAAVYKKGHTVYAWVDNLRLRHRPSSKAKTVDYIGEGEKLTLLGKQSKAKLRLKLRGKTFREPWVKVRTLYNTTGWVYGGAVRKRKVPLKPRLLFPSSYHFDEVTSKSGTSFLTLVKRKNRYSLVPGRVIVKKAPDPIYEEETGKKVLVKGIRGKAIFMIKGLNLKPRSYVKNVSKYTYNGLNHRGIKLKIRKGSSYYLNVKCSEEYGCKIYLQNGKTQTVLENYGGYISAIWKGDINGDGALDFLISYSGDNSLTEVLFLSSRKGGKIFLKPVVKLHTVGC